MKTQRKIRDITISVLIVTRNRYESLFRTIQSILFNTIPPLEIVIIDSSDTNYKSFSADVLRDESKKIIIRYKKIAQKNLRHSLNTGIKMCKGVIIARIDDDERASSNWIKNIIGTFHAFPEYKVITGPMIPSYLHNYWNRVWHAFLKPSYAKITKESNFVPGANGAYKRNIFKNSSLLFNEANPFSSEDSELSFKLVSQNIKILHCYKIKVFHDFRTTFASFFYQWFHYGRGDMTLWLLHKDYVSYCYNNKYSSKNLNFVIVIKLIMKNLKNWAVPNAALHIKPGLFVRDVAYSCGALYCFFNQTKLFKKNNNKK